MYACTRVTKAGSGGHMDEKVGKKTATSSVELGWLSGLGLVLARGGHGFESRLIFEFFFFSSTFENFLSFFGGLVCKYSKH